jgi:4-hydroxy-tetrahydrodipicolinate reductase
MERERYRVAQWATGHTGMHSLRKIIEHPRYDLVGLYTYSDAKAGRDAGDICGMTETGVVATRDIDDIIAAKPDCVLYMPLLDHESIDDMCRLLGSGANIVTPVVGFYHPPSLDPEVRQRLEAACERGGSSLYGTGPGPGYILLDVPLTLAVMERRLDRISILQHADVSHRQSPEWLAQTFGFSPADAPQSRPARRMGLADGACLRQFADAVGAPLDDVTRTVNWAVATETVEVAAGTVEAGTVAAWRFTITGLRRGNPFVEFDRSFFVTRALDPVWELPEGESGWRVRVDGDAPMNVDIRWSREQYDRYSPGINAHVVVNAVTAVCKAPPGILTADQLRPVPCFG